MGKGIAENENSSKFWKVTWVGSGVVHLYFLLEYHHGKNKTPIYNISIYKHQVVV